MKKIRPTMLSNKAINTLKKIASIKKYNIDSPLFYQGQTPIVASFIIKGTILLLNKSKVCHKLGKGCLVGYKELFLNLPSIFTAKALSDTEIYYIDKSTLKEVRNSSDPDVHQLYIELSQIVAP